MMSTAERLMSRVIADGDCLRWTGAHTQKGYGQMRVGGKACAVHRLSYELFVGPIPAGLEIDHLCRTRDCLRPEHLEAVTHAENVARRPMPPTCPNGHAMSGSNRIVTRSGSRACRACRNARQRAYKASLRQKGDG